MYKLNNVLHFLQDFNSDVMTVLKRKRKVFKDFRKSKSNLFTVVSYVNMYPELLNKMDYSKAEVKTMTRFFGTLSESEISDVVDGLWTSNKEYIPLTDNGQNIPQIKQLTKQIRQLPVAQQVKNQIRQQKIRQQIVAQQINQQDLDLQDVDKQVSKYQYFDDWQQFQQGYDDLPTGTVNIEIDFAGTRAYIVSNFKAEKVKIEGDVVWSNVSNSWELLADDNNWNRRQKDFYDVNKLVIDELVDNKFISLQQYV